MDEPLDVAVAGAGAAGLAAAIFAARATPSLRIAALDGAMKIGAKILVSGGGRCNVTNKVVVADDFNGGSRNVVRRILDRFPVAETVAFFRSIGVALHEEPEGKLFPDSNRARTVLDALLAEAGKRGVRLLTGRRVEAIARAKEGFEIATPAGPLAAKRVILATGGLSLPKTGSDGAGYRIAEALGHTRVATTPALDPLTLSEGIHAALSGIAQPVELTLRIGEEKPLRIRGSMLWTHFGISGPAALDASRHWLRARLEGRPVTVTASLLPEEDLASLEGKLLSIAKKQPKTHLDNALSTLLPAKVSAAVVDHLGMKGSTPLAHLKQEDRRKVLRSLLEWPLPVAGSRGYGHAEVTAGGIPLAEIDPATLASRRCPGLFFAGEILDVDGRLGGFNFQWAWASGRVAGEAAAR